METSSEKEALQCYRIRAKMYRKKENSLQFIPTHSSHVTFKLFMTIIKAPQIPFDQPNNFTRA